jgi:apolipoprotein N-acyltransferase
MGLGRGGVAPSPVPPSALAAAAGSALLFALALPPAPLPVLLFPAFLLLAGSMSHLPRRAAVGPGPAFRAGGLLGAIFGGLHALLVLHWLPAAAWPYLGALAFPAALSAWGVHALAGLVSVGGAAAVGLPLPLAVPLAWGVLAWLPGALPVTAVPWPGPELALVEWPRMASLLPLVGSTGVGVLLSGGAAFLVSRGARGVGVGLLAAVAWAGVEGGLPSDPAADAPPPLFPQGRVALVELPRDPELGPHAARGDGARQLRALVAARALPVGPEPEAWPEAPVRDPWTVASPPAGASGGGEGGELPFRALLRERVVAGGPLVTGGFLEGEGVRRNGALLLKPRGEVDAGVAPSPPVAPRVVHAKGRLVPGVERTVLFRPGGPGRGLAPGPPSEPFRWGELSTGILICFEVLFPAEAARLRRGGAQLLLQLSNDSALGSGQGPFPVVADAARRQHEAFLRARAVEFAVPVARSAMGSPAAGWDRRGRRLPELEREEAGDAARVVVHVPPAGPPPPAAHLQPSWGPAMAALLGLLLLWRGRGSPRSLRLLRGGSPSTPGSRPGSGVEGPAQS